jgi:hypothetical protein
VGISMVILFGHFLGKQDAEEGYLRHPVRADNNVFWVCATTDHEGPTTSLNELSAFVKFVMNGSEIFFFLLQIFNYRSST